MVKDEVIFFEIKEGLLDVKKDKRKDQCILLQNPQNLLKSWFRHLVLTYGRLI